MPTKNKSGTLIIISAPSGTGKSTLINKLLESPEGKNYFMSVSHTTRNPRPGEVDGVHYHFVSINTFKELIDKNEFIEYAEVYGNYYGTSKAAIQNKLEEGVNIILDIDWQGARNVRLAFPEAKSIFIQPPSIDILQERLFGRKTDSEEVINNRMKKALAEMSHANEYDEVILNDNFDTCYSEFIKVLKSFEK